MSELSVIVCTHNRLDELELCLAALARDCPQAEVVVVDSAPAVPCEELVHAHARSFEALRYVRVDDPGLSLARNRGVEASSGSLIAFLDDDAAALPGWAAAVVGAFSARPATGCVGGACVPRFDGERPSWLSERLLQLASITRWGSRARRPRSSAEWPFGANMSFRRETLHQAGLFSTELGRKGTSSLLSGEDSDMVARVLAAGWEVWLEPAAAVEHKVHAERLRSGFYWRRFWWGGVSRAQAPSALLTARVVAAAPVRLLAWIATRDRIFLYRQAEAAGYLVTLLRGFALRSSRGRQRARREARQHALD